MKHETLRDHSQWREIDLQRFDNVTEFFNHAEKLAPYKQRFGQDLSFMQRARGSKRKVRITADEFMGHRDPAEAVDYCRTMDDSHLRHARELMDKIDAGFRDREKVVWQAAPMGAYPIVPDYLANDPFSMRMKGREENTQAPIRYYIECGISAGVQLHEMERRAAAIAALIMRTIEERPVELYVYGAWSCDNKRQGQIVIVPVDSHPIDLFATIAMIGTREVCRSIMFANLESRFGDQLTIPWLFGYPGDYGVREERERQLRKYMELEPTDVLMMGGALHDAAAFDRDPVEWVHKQLEKQRSVET